jgi:hypothetical protein
LKRDEVMAQHVDLARAKAALLYRPPKQQDPDVDHADPGSSLANEDVVTLIDDIIRAQEALSLLKARTERQRLLDEWSDPLGKDLVEALNCLVVQHSTLRDLHLVDFCCHSSINRN